MTVTLFMPSHVTLMDSTEGDAAWMLPCSLFRIFQINYLPFVLQS